LNSGKHPTLVVLGLAALAVGASQTTAAQPAGERGAGAPMQLAQEWVPPRGRAFQGQPEFPPPGYLAEFEEAPDGRPARIGQPSLHDYAPGATGVMPPAAERGQRHPEFAPSGYDRSLQAGPPGRETPRSDFGSPMERGTPAPIPGPVPGRADFPGMPGGPPGRGEAPVGDPRWTPTPYGPGPMPEHQWPSAPVGSYLTQPEFAPERLERGRTGSPPGAPGAPQYPPPGWGWPR